MAVAKSVEDVFDVIANMSLMEISELTDLMEDKLGVSAASAVVAAVAPGAAAETAAAEKTEFDVILSSFGSSKVSVIKVVRILTGLGLKEAKELVEAAPSTIKEAVSKEEAEVIKKQLDEAGGSSEIK